MNAFLTALAVYMFVGLVAFIWLWVSLRAHANEQNRERDL